MKAFKLGIDISGVEWRITKPRGIVVISHGMAEHIERYDEFSNFLNTKGFSAYGINHIGHGAAITKPEEKGHFPKGGFMKCVDNLDKLVEMAKKENPGLPVFLLGHSMGSFMAQTYAGKYGNNVKGVILSGTNAPCALFAMGNTVAHIAYCCGDMHKGGKLLDNMSFGSYGKQFAPNRTKFDWLSRDNAHVDAYVNDPLCGYLCTKGFYKEFLSGNAKLGSWLKKVPVELPIYLFSGDKDPVGQNGEGVKTLYEMYKAHGVVDVEMKLYPDGRHESLNEINRAEVMKDVVVWLEKHI